MTKLVLLAALAIGCVDCTDEDGSPDPSIRQLVPCDPDAAPSDPLACPNELDAAVADEDGGVDLGTD